MSDWFTRAFGNALDDIREKLVEEAWFGRAVTPADHGHPQELDHATDAERDPLGRTHDIGIDR